jgi:hypothetical protein
MARTVPDALAPSPSTTKKVLGKGGMPRTFSVKRGFTNVRLQMGRGVSDSREDVPD